MRRRNGRRKPARLVRSVVSALLAAALFTGSALAADSPAVSDGSAAVSASVSAEAPSVQTTHVDKSKITRKRTVPVLMYHAVSDDIWGIESLFLSPSSFRKQLQYLKDNGYQTITFEDLGHLSDYTKPVLLTFDDGYADNYTTVYPMLQEFGMKATFFVTYSNLGGSRCMTKEQIKEISDSGVVSVQSHTYSHTNFKKLSAADQEYELQASQAGIASITGKTPIACAYPEGGYTSATAALASKYYDFCVCAGGGQWKVSNDFYHIARCSMERSTTMQQFQRYVDESVPHIFKDVSSKRWSVPYIQQVYNAGYMCGTGGDTFSPAQGLSRAACVQLLYAIAGKPNVAGQTPFRDVSQSAWYANAVLWAYQNGITSGVSRNAFRPDASVTREQFAQMLYRYCGSPAVSGSLSGFSDAGSVSAWALDSMRWAVQCGIIRGVYSRNTRLLLPRTNITREQAATMIAATFC